MRSTKRFILAAVGLLACGGEQQAPTSAEPSQRVVAAVQGSSPSDAGTEPAPTPDAGAPPPAAPAPAPDAGQPEQPDAGGPRCYQTAGPLNDCDMSLYNGLPDSPADSRFPTITGTQANAFCFCRVRKLAVYTECADISALSEDAPADCECLAAAGLACPDAGTPDAG